MMIQTPVDTSVQLVRAHAIGRTLTRSGWIRGREPAGAHPGAADVAAYRHGGVGVLILILAPRHGQIVEIIADRVPRVRAASGGRSVGGRPGWRLTCYSPPVEAAVAAAFAACHSRAGFGPREADGWRLDLNHGTDVKRPRTSVFHRPDRAAIAVFHTPTYTPPCEGCAHHGDLGDAGGWTITAPGTFAEATAHTPADVIAALVMGLPEDPVRRGPRSIPAAEPVAVPAEASAERTGR